VPHHGLCDAAENQPADATAAMAAEHDQVGWPILRSVNNLVGWLPDRRERKRAGLHFAASANFSEQTFCTLLRKGDLVSGGNSRFRQAAFRGVDDGNRRHVTLQCTGQIEPNVRPRGPRSDCLRPR
jgi:hypothetical protein